MQRRDNERRAAPAEGSTISIAETNTRLWQAIAKLLRATAISGLGMVIALVSFATTADARDSRRLVGERKGYPNQQWKVDAAKELFKLHATMGAICAVKQGVEFAFSAPVSLVDAASDTVQGFFQDYLIGELTGAGDVCEISQASGAIGWALWEKQGVRTYVRLAQYEVDKGIYPDPCRIEMQVNKFKQSMTGRAGLTSACGASIGSGNFESWELPKRPTPTKPPPGSSVATPISPSKPPAPAPPKAPAASPSYTWKWVSQGQFTDSSKAQALDPNNLSPGQRGWLVVEAKNTGTATWTNSGPSPVMLGTDAPRDRNSVLATKGWVRPNRPAYLKQASVPPGGVGTFEFEFVAPQSGSVREDFNVLAEHGTWFNSNGLYFELRISTPTPAPPPPSGPPVNRTIYEVWRGGPDATAVGYNPGAWSMVEFRVPADSPWIRRSSANIGGTALADFHIYLREGGGFREIVSANGVSVANNAETWADLPPTRLDPDKVYLLQVVLPQGGAVYHARQPTPGGLRTYTWCDERPSDGCPHNDFALNGRIVTSDRP